jgi:hypothetical protein
VVWSAVNCNCNRTVLSTSISRMEVVNVAMTVKHVPEVDPKMCQPSKTVAMTWSSSERAALVPPLLAN